MSRVIRSSMAVVLLLSFTGCSEQTLIVPTTEILNTPTAIPSLVEPGSAAAPPSEIPTAVATAAAPTLPADFSPILYGKRYDANTFFILLGGVQGDIWVAPELAAAQLAGIPAAGYDVYPFTRNHFQVRGAAPQFSPPYRIYTVGTETTVAEAGMVAVAQGWPILQRDIQEITADNELYRQVILDWLAAEGVAEPELGALRVLRVDLEGDGVNEIFLSATRLDESQHTTQAGDYSLILMRRTVGNEVLTVPITGEIYSSPEPEITYPRTYSLANFLDLNRDGVLEVIVEIAGWEKAGAIIYQIDEGEIIESLRVE